MNRPQLSRKTRFFLLHSSSLQLATVLLSGLALVFAGFLFGPATPWWLVLLSAFLVLVSSGVLLRVGPVMWRDMVHYRRIRHRSRMQSMRNHVSWRLRKSPQRLAEQCQAVLAEQGYTVRQDRRDGMIWLNAMQGRLNRFGFILVHFAVILILFGALQDSDLWRRYQTGKGNLSIEPRPLPRNEMAGQSRIGPRSGLAFQGSKQLHIGQMTDEVRIMLKRGGLVKRLPYTVAVNAVELDADQPLLENNFLTYIAILDPHLDRPVTAVLGNNRPFHYRGLDYYQQAIEDGGSELTIAMWPLAHVQSAPLKFRTRIKAERRLQTRQGTISIRFTDLKPRNIMAMQTGITGPSKYTNIGPSLFYRVSDELSHEREFINYMLPVLQDGRYFYISGVRHNDTEPFRFIHIPVDRRGGPDLFFKFHAALYDQLQLDRASDKVLREAGKTAKTAEYKALKTTLTELAGLFRAGGFTAIDESIGRRVDKAHYRQSRMLSHKLVRSLLYALYIDLDKHGRQSSGQRDQTDLLFFEDAIMALADLAKVRTPFYVQLQDMNFKPVVTLLVSYKPGKALFFTGWFMLLSGMLAGFYSYHRRIWLLFRQDGDDTVVTLAGMSSRQRQRFTREFNGLFSQLQEHLGAC